MANGNGSGSNINGAAMLKAVTNTDFQNLSVADQQSVLAQFHPDIARLSANDIPGLVNALQKTALTRPDIVQPPPPAGAGTPQQVPNYTSQALNPAGGYTSQGQFLANTTPEQRNQLAVAGGVGLGAGTLAAGA